MRSKRAQGESGSMIAVVIGIAIVVIVVVVYVIFAPKVFGSSIFPYFRPGLSNEQQQTTISEFESIIENLEKCYRFQENNCKCKVFETFPGTFVKNSKLVLEEKNKVTNISIKYENKIYNTKKLNFIIYLVVMPGLDFVKGMVIDNKLKWFDYKKEPAFLDTQTIGKTKPAIASRYFYKKDNKLYVMVSYSKLEQVQGAIEKIPDCK